MTATIIAKAVREGATVVRWDKVPIPPERWGKDHWSTIAFAETRAVDYGGILATSRIDALKMRPRESEYPTRLSRDENPLTDLLGHGDMDCLHDAEAAGLLRVERGYLVRKRGGARVFVLPGERDPRGDWVIATRVVFTPLGNQVCGDLRTHKANGGNFGDFRWAP